MTSTIELYGPALPFVSKRSYLVVGKLVLIFLLLIGCIVSLVLVRKKHQRMQHAHTDHLLSLPPDRFITELMLRLAQKYPHAVAWGNTALLQARWANQATVELYQKTIEGVMPKEKLIKDLKAMIEERGYRK